MILRKAAAFVVRDFLIESSYKLNFLARLFNSFALLVFFFFFSRMIPQNGAVDMSRFGGNYFNGVVVGLALAGFFQLTLSLYAESIRRAQMNGCLEAMLSTQTGPVTVVLLSSLYSLLAGLVQLVLFFTLGKLIFHFDTSQINVGASLLIFFVSMLTFVAIGILSAAAIVVLKRGDPISWIFSSLGAMMGGAYFPVEVMPSWLQKLSWLFPIRHALDALRMTLLQGRGLSEVAEPARILTAMAALLFPLSLFLFSLAVQKGRREGTLTQY
jgi:ABC-2 type transport system permease protein